VILGLAIELAAIITPSVALVIVTLANVVWNARLTEQARQREKNQGRRATLYIDYLVFMRKVDEGMDPQAEPDRPILAARMAAFGSDEVKSLVADYWSARGDARKDVRKLIEAQVAKEMRGG